MLDVKLINYFVKHIMTRSINHLKKLVIISLLSIVTSLNTFADETVKSPKTETSGFEWIEVVYRSNGEGFAGATTKSGDWIIPLGDHNVYYSEQMIRGYYYGFFVVTKKYSGDWTSALYSPAGDELVKYGRYGTFFWSNDKILGTGPSNYETISISLNKLSIENLLTTSNSQNVGNIIPSENNDKFWYSRYGDAKFDSTGDKIVSTNYVYPSKDSSFEIQFEYKTNKTVTIYLNEIKGNNSISRISTIGTYKISDSKSVVLKTNSVNFFSLTHHVVVDNSGAIIIYNISRGKYVSAKIFQPNEIAESIYKIRYNVLCSKLK